jgi:hypothetical protein
MEEETVGTPWGREIRPWACGSRRGSVADSVQQSAGFPLSAVSSRHLKVSRPRAQRTGEAWKTQKDPDWLGVVGGVGALARVDRIKVAGT